MRTYLYFQEATSTVTDAEARVLLVAHDMARAVDSEGLWKKLREAGVFYCELDGDRRAAAEDPDVKRLQEAAAARGAPLRKIRIEVRA